MVRLIREDSAESKLNDVLSNKPDNQDIDTSDIVDVVNNLVDDKNSQFDDDIDTDDIVESNVCPKCGKDPCICDIEERYTK